ncbi:hypothetical protein RKD37_005564 [Streptomyces ambofaciens]
MEAATRIQTPNRRYRPGGMPRAWTVRFAGPGVVTDAEHGVVAGREAVEHARVLGSATDELCGRVQGFR